MSAILKFDFDWLRTSSFYILRKCFEWGTQPSLTHGHPQAKLTPLLFLTSGGCSSDEITSEVNL